MNNFKFAGKQIVIVFAMLFLAIIANAQQLNLELKNVTVREFVQKVAQQTDYKFVFSEALKELENRVSVSAKDEKLEPLLNRVLAKEGIIYKIEGKQILLSSKAIINKKGIIVVKGKVTESTSGEPIPGAVILLKEDNSKYAIADSKGEYEISVPEDGHLSICNMGMVNQEIPVNKRNYIEIGLQPDFVVLSDVVVTGYQTLSRERATGSFVTISESQLHNKPQIDLMQRLEGMTAGLMINSGDISIRGITTLQGNSKPLLVVDGFIWDDFNTDLLNSDNIKSVTVLKDASAASIYGTRSANGVIVITTKSGQAGKTKVSAKYQHSITQLPSNSGRDILTADEMVTLQQELYRVYGSNLNRRDASFWPDAIDLLYRKDKGYITESDLNSQLAFMRTADNSEQIRKMLLNPKNEQVYSINVSGGSEKNTFYIGGEYLENKNVGFERGVGSNRINLNIKDNINFNKWLSGTLGTILSYDNQYGHSVRALELYATAAPWRMLTDNGGNTIGWNQGKPQEEKERLLGIGLRNEKYNPLDEKQNNSSENSNYNYRINGTLKAKIAEGIDFTLMYENARQVGYSKNLAGANSYNVNNMINNAAQLTAGNDIIYNIPLGGQINEGRSITSSNTLRGQLNFNKTFNELHSINAIFGGERHRSFTNITNIYRLGYNDKTLNWSLIDEKKLANRITGTQSMTGDFTLYGFAAGNNFMEVDDRFVSLYSNVAYSYGDKYILTGSIRWDDSNLFGAKYRSVPLWSAGFSWNVTKEPFININFLNLLRLRATYGVNGNVPKGSSGSFLVVSAGTNTQLGTEYHKIINPPNDNLTWEKTTTYNIGADIALLGNRLNINWDYYFRKTNDMLGYIMADPTFGWSTVLRNYGRMNNHGTEFTINSLNINKQDFKWSTDFVLSYNKNKLVESYMSNPSVSSYLASNNVQEYPLSPLFSYKYAGLSTNGEPLAYDLDGNKVNNIDNFEALVYGGTRRPTYNGSFTNTFTYKRVNLSFMLIFNGGHVTRMDQVPYIANNFGKLFGNVNRDILDRWQKPGDENNPNATPAVRLENTIFGDMVWSYRDSNVIKADYISFRNITLSYDVPSKFVELGGLSSARAYLQVQNPAIWAADKNNLHPEGPLAGFGVLGLKRTPTWVFGLSINL